MEGVKFASVKCEVRTHSRFWAAEPEPPHRLNPSRNYRRCSFMFKLKFKENSDVIFTTFFSSKPNPHFENGLGIEFAPRNLISYIFGWYVSVLYLKLNAVVIHDGLSSEFIREHETDTLQFVEYLPQRYSLNDERYFALDRILQENRLGKVLMTDGSDLIIKKNPFEFITDKDLLYFGSDETSKPLIRDNPWCINKLASLQENKAIALEPSILDFHYINAGVFGGTYVQVREFTRALVLLFECLDNNNNNNMMAINYMLWKFGIRHFKGQPLTSPFKKYDLQGDYYIIHK
jgi:hypothetical protein